MGWSPVASASYRLDEEQWARAVAQLGAVSAAWGGRLRRVKRLAEALQETSTTGG
ncbi:hypothetical protein [Nocardioides marmoribigeumensis]|uniref:Uncharacterized protein n=1 Tax=Nocardioides marmoribigeumensis TaxID=433649 RepID=A0ABU2BW79_9ACTN|nr:hypothetical protein [Nocardioides marmoribigeumensis]MDR7362887.1 hypothetical protein [Nocardioides marmoribigeumensis]